MPFLKYSSVLKVARSTNKIAQAARHFRGRQDGHEGVVKLLLGREDVDPDRPGEYGTS